MMRPSPVGRAVLLLAVAATTVLPILNLVDLLTGSAGPVPGDPVVEPFLLALTALSIINGSVGVTILWRRPGNRVGALLVAGALLLTSVAWTWWWLIQPGVPERSSTAIALTWWAVVSILPAVYVLFPTVGLFFPDGRLPGPRWRLPFGAATAALVAGLALQTVAPLANEPGENPFLSPFTVQVVPVVAGDIGASLTIAGVLAAFVLALGSVVVRFRRSRDVERAQVKWLVAAIVVNSVLFPLSYFFEIGPQGSLDVVSVLAGCLIPVAIGIAVLRYRLYEIDRLISRTVSWTVVTAGVLAVFALLVVGLQSALAGFTQGETVAVALSTIVAAALFQPVRRRVQQRVDRRFDRGRYDSERMAAAFAERLRDDVDLDTLTSELRQTVGMAVRPTTTDIWLLERTPR